MIVNYTDAEKAKIDRLEKKYEKLFADAEAEIERQTSRIYTRCKRN